MSYKKFTKDIGILGLTQIIMAISGIITLPLITKLLGVKDYGIWTQLSVTLGLIAPIAVLNLPYTLVRFLAGEKDKKEIQDGIWTSLSIIFGASAIIAMFFIVFSGPISVFFNCDKILIKILAFGILFGYPSTIFFAILRAFQENAKYCIITIFQSLIQTGLIILAVFLGYGLLGIFLCNLFISFVSFLITIFFIVKKFGAKFPQFLKIKEYLSFGLPNLFSDLSFWAVQSSDNYLIGFFLGTIFVGYYAPAYTLGGFIAFFVTPLGFILPAILSKHHDENNIDDVKNYLRYSLKYFLMLAIPAVFGISVLAKQLLSVFSTHDIALHSYLVVPFVALSMLFFGICTILDQVIALKKKTKISGTIWIISALLNIGLNIVLVPRLGIIGAAATTLLSYTFAFLSICYYSFKELHFEIEWSFIFKSAAAAIMMSIIISLQNPLGLVKTLLTILSGVVAYFICLFLFKGLSKTEINSLKELLGPE